MFTLPLIRILITLKVLWFRLSFNTWLIELCYIFTTIPLISLSLPCCHNQHVQVTTHSNLIIYTVWVLEIIFVLLTQFNINTFCEL